MHNIRISFMYIKDTYVIKKAKMIIGKTFAKLLIVRTTKIFIKCLLFLRFFKVLKKLTFLDFFLISFGIKIQKIESPIKPKKIAK